MSLPTRHRDGHAMARVLVQYMSDARAVRRAILGEFHDAPSVNTIAALRGSWLRRPDQAQPAASHSWGWDWTGARDYDVMGRASRVMVQAIERERGRQVMLP